MGRTRIPFTLTISKEPAKTLSKSLFLPPGSCSCLLTSWLSGGRTGNGVREVWGHQAGTSCPCETGGKCAASARCGSASKSFLTACSCQTHPCHLALHSMSKAGGQRLLVHQGCGQQQHPWVSQTLTNPGHDFPRSEQDQSSYRVLIPLIKTLVCYPCKPCREQCQLPGTIPQEAPRARGAPLFTPFPSVFTTEHPELSHPCSLAFLLPSPSLPLSLPPSPAAGAAGQP